jgi:hypothetical protein
MLFAAASPVISDYDGAERINRADMAAIRVDAPNGMPSGNSHLFARGLGRLAALNQ